MAPFNSKEGDQEMAESSDPTVLATSALARGTRQLVTGDFESASEELSSACELLTSIYGTGEEVAEAYLLYAKALLGCAREEAKVLDINDPGQESEEDSDDEADCSVVDALSKTISPKKAKDDSAAGEEAKKESEASEAEVSGSKCELPKDKSDKSEVVVDISDESKVIENKHELVQKKSDEPIVSTEKSDEPSATKEKIEKLLVTNAKSDGASVSEDKSDETSAPKGISDESKDAEAPKEEKLKESENKTDKSEVKTNVPTTAVPNDEKVSNGNGELKKGDQEMETDENEPGNSSKQSIDEGVEVDAPSEAEGDEEEPVGPLQLAWEVLELASKVYSNKGPEGHVKLAEVHSVLGEVSLESGNFDTALQDFTKSLDLLKGLPDNNDRMMAEAHFKIGLTHSMINQFEESVTHLKSSVELIDKAIKDLEAIAAKKDENGSKVGDHVVTELQQLKEEVLEKITDVNESKEQSVELVREQLKKIMPTQVTTDGSGPSTVNGGADIIKSSVNETGDAKPAADINHLIKRKRKADETEDELAATAKRPTP